MFMGVNDMVFNDAYANNILNYSKMMINDVNKNKMCSGQLKAIQSLIFAGMLSYYGFDNISDIYEAFFKTNFVYCDEPLEIVVTKIGGVSKEFLESVKEAEHRAFLQDEIICEGPARYKAKRTIYMFEEDGLPFDIFLEGTVHEMNHVVNSIRRNNKITSRVGVSFKGLFQDSNYNEANILEESFNTLQTAEIMQHILSFVDYDIDDLEIKAVVDRLRGVARQDRPSMGYEYTVPIVKPLYEHPHFNLILKEKRIAGDIKVIRDEFDSKTSPGAFLQLADTLEKIGICPAFDNRSVFNQANANRLVKEYVKARGN